MTRCCLPLSHPTAFVINSNLYGSFQILILNRRNFSNLPFLPPPLFLPKAIIHTLSAGKKVSSKDTGVVFCGERKSRSNTNCVGRGRTWKGKSETVLEFIPLFSSLIAISAGPLIISMLERRKGREGKVQAHPQIPTTHMHRRKKTNFHIFRLNLDA